MSEERDTDSAIAALARCSGCEHRVEWCAFCDEESCSAAICLSCMSVELKESLAQPHPHGG